LLSWCKSVKQFGGDVKEKEWGLALPLCLLHHSAIKAGETITPDYFNGLKQFRKVMPDLSRRSGSCSNALYAGHKYLQLHPGAEAAAGHRKGTGQF
jgi:hypothetical protein